MEPVRQRFHVGLGKVGSLALLSASVWLGGVMGDEPRGRTDAAAAPARGPERAPDDQPEDEREERLALGRRSFIENCLMCHTDEIPAGQRLTPAQWKTEVDKMIGWGAPVPADQKEALTEYLTATFSTEAAPAPPARMSIEDALALVRPQPAPDEPRAGDRERGAALFAKDCATCHGPDALGADLGTCLVEKPVLLRTAEFREVVRKGRRRMPGFQAALKPDQEADLLAWLRQQRYRGPKQP